MRQRLFGFGGWVVALVVLATSGAMVRAQVTAGVKDGSFVQAADGSVWVVANGTRVGIAPAPDRDGTLAGLREGATVATIDELNAALAAASPAPAATAYLDYTFTAKGQSSGFFAQGRVDVCWEITPSGMSASMTLNPEGSAFWVDGGFFNGVSRTGCRAVDIAAGQYYINLDILQASRGATTSLHVTVRPSP